MRRLLIVFCLILCPIVPDAEAEQPVRVGFVRTAAPWIAAALDGRPAQVDGQRLRWQPFATSADVALAIDAGHIDAGVLSSTAIAAAIARGVKIRVLYIVNVVQARHVVIFRDGRGIDPTRPASMAGRSIGVTFLSAAHQALLTAMSENGLTLHDVRLVNLAPSEMEAAWKSGRVDGVCLGGTRTAAVLAALAGQRVLFEPQPDGPFHALVTTDAWIARAPKQAKLLVNMMAREAAESAEPASRPREPGPRVVRDSEESPLDPKQFRFPSLVEQLSPEWFGDGAKGGLARRLAVASAVSAPVEGRRLDPADFAAVAAVELMADVRETEAGRR